MAVSPVYDEISLISKGLYRIVSDILGPECIVKLRRQTWNIDDDFANSHCYSDTTQVTSGSRAEGFAFKCSDYDKVLIDRNAIVLTCACDLTTPRNSMPTILFMETENVSPGSALIRCLRYDHKNRALKDSLVLRSTGIYVSSKHIRESFMAMSMTRTHGPCQKQIIMGAEQDRAYALRCPVWPTEAMSFVYRSLRQGWPSYDTLAQICKDGCLFVPINNKKQQYSDMTDLQWRISFSLAEKKLICSMNHCQFLCYGLSKLLLNEVLKMAYPNEDLLCSYFIKTAVFWEISENRNDWSPFNFMSNFWNVFRRLINWVRIGYCPNFFIPENNMFSEKMYGDAQTTLLGKLLALYMDGYWSLLRCPSLNGHLSKLISHPEIAYTLSCNEMEYVPLQRIENCKLDVIFKFDILIDNTLVEDIMTMLKKMLKMMNSESAEIICLARLGVKHVLHVYAQNLFISKQSPNFYKSRNRMKYNNFKAAQFILWRTKTFFCWNFFILIQNMYMAGNYHRTIEMIHYTRHKLQSQPYMYRWALDYDIIMTLLQQGMSYDTVAQSLIVSEILLSSLNDYTSIEELKFECLAVEQTVGPASLHIPPLVFLNFLLILSYTRVNANHRRYDILDELHVLLYHDDHHIAIPYKAISWEILGISQQLCGDLRGAHRSYRRALKDEYNNFKHATMVRILSLTGHYFTF